MLNRNFIFSLSLFLGSLIESGYVLSADFQDSPSQQPEAVYYEGLHIQTAFVQRDDIRRQFKTIGQEYLDECKARDGNVSKDFIKGLFQRHLPVILNVSQDNISSIIDSYENETNLGTIIGHQVSGTQYLQDDTRMQGYVFVALAQLLKQKEDETLRTSQHRHGVHNLFDLPLAENDPLYRSTMEKGLNCIIGNMTGGEVRAYIMVDESFETVCPDSKETSEEKEADTTVGLLFLTTLANTFLPMETLESSVVATWRNDGLALFAQYPNDGDTRGKIIQRKIKEGYASLQRRMNSTPHHGEEIEDRLLNMVEDYIHSVLNGTLYASKDLRDERTAIQEAVFIRAKMPLLVAQYLKKQNPDFSNPDLVNAVTTYLREKQPYTMIIDSFKLSDDKKADHFMLTWGEYGGIWGEYVFGYPKAKGVVEKYKDQVFTPEFS